VSSSVDQAPSVGRLARNPPFRGWGRRITLRAEQQATREIVVEDVLSHAPAAVWKTLTSGELISRWLMPNDFEPVIGRRFTFRTKPMGGWDGVVHCEVLEMIPNERLVYSWKGGLDDNPAYGSRLDSSSRGR
jgi:uncharacterized protein YndB with AHSA1/START domain